MKNKDGKLLLSFAAVGVVIVGIILYMNINHALLTPLNIRYYLK